jgi:hypothetical protein
MTVSVRNLIFSLTLWLFTYKMSSCTTSRNLPSNVWWLHKWQTELSPLHCDFICKKSQVMGDNSVCHWYSHQILLGKSLGVVQEEMLYVKSHKVREIIQFVTDTVIRHCWQVSRCSTRINFICKNYKVREIIQFVTLYYI